MLLNMLATIPEDTAQQITELHERLVQSPEALFNIKFLVVLLILVAVMVGMMYRRQQKIANNQVELAKLFEQILKK